MHQNFADWYQPVTFGHDRETLDSRWQGVEAALNDMKYEMIMELIRFVFSRELNSHELFASTFRQYFKDADPTFALTGNDKEVLTLAGCVLAMYCINDDYIVEIALAILAASACEIRTLAIDIDLLGMANERVHVSGIEARRRPEMSSPAIAGNKAAFAKAVSPLEEEEGKVQGFAEAAEAIKNIGNISLSHFNALQSMSVQIVKIQKVLRVQDEELQILWWLTGEWSSMWDCSFNDIDPKAKPILLGEDAASMTTEFSEPPSLKSVFSRIGLNGTTKLSIPVAVNACGVEYLGTLSQSSATCSTILPIHFAMVRAKETGGDDSWVAAWRTITGIKATSKVTPLELAIQVHRERKLMSYIQENSE